MKNQRFVSTTLILYLLIGVILIQIILPASAMAKRRCSLENILITNTRDDLISYFTVTGAFTEKMSEAVLKGVPASFSFFVSVYRKRDAWFDQKIADINISTTLKYNSLKQDFTVIRPWKTDKPFITTSFDQAKDMACNIYNLKILSLDQLVKGEQYQIRLKAEMNKATLPLYLHYVFFFISFWDFETDWYTINMIY
ncbi:MAG: DUF4390 domain-containing protein [Desulfamplus sp.]|nr:DUF4390 domain-containing protein [Desulfamplus sp.]MBF0259810.1 DUF4390 domain-containing protein [Desulfamplus sp.]